jgi:hypothetical protein
VAESRLLEQVNSCSRSIAVVYVFKETYMSAASVLTDSSANNDIANTGDLAITLPSAVMG